MFTRKRLPSFAQTGDWKVDGPRLVKWIDAYFRSLEQKNALTISQAQIYADQGLAFPATQVLSTDPNTLDDYEEGVWVPVLTFATPGSLAVNYGVQDGTYTKIGNTVFAWFSITTSLFTLGTASGNLELTGLPFAIAPADGNFTATAIVQWQGITKTGYTQIAASGATTKTFVAFVASGSAQPLAAVTAADTPTGGTIVLRGLLVYSV